MTPRHIRPRPLPILSNRHVQERIYKAGNPAEDYDIQDEYGQTDHVIDLFA